MRGSPLLRLILVVAGLLALAVPLRSLTTHRAPEPTAVATRGGESMVDLDLTSTMTPFHFEISHLGKVIWRGDSPAPGVSKQLPLSFPTEGVDLLVEVSWPDTTPAAVKVELTPPSGEPITKLLWGEGSASEVLTFR